MAPAFIGREAELEQLRQFLESPEPSIFAVYGRRRIGKTFLIRKALEGRKFLLFEGLEDRPPEEQISSFMIQLDRQLDEQNRAQAPTIAGAPATWTEAFLAMFDAISDDPCPIVLDELQWMASYRNELVTELRLVWSTQLSLVRGQKLLLCGSIASFMINDVINSSSLYGHIDDSIELTGFKLSETRQLLRGRGVDEVMHAQMLTGGVAKYLRLLKKFPSVHLAMDKLAFTRNGYLTTEYNRLFTSHFGKNPAFEKIVRALAEHPYGMFREDIAEATGITLGGQLTDQLRDLESAGFISAATPFNKDWKSRQIKYFLTDAYTRFYFSFILPNMDAIRAQPRTEIFPAISQTSAYDSWLGRAFEYLCMQHATILAEVLGFSGIRYKMGPYFAPARKKGDGVQADLVFDRADDVVTLCEMKCSNSPIGTDIIAEVERKVALIEPIADGKTIQRVLILYGRATKNLLDQGYFYRIIDAPATFLASKK